MKRTLYLLTAVSLLLFLLGSCSRKVSPVIQDLQSKKAMYVTADDGELIFSFNQSGVNPKRLLTSSEYSRYQYRIQINPVSFGPDALSVYIHYQNEGTFFRLDLYPASGMISGMQSENGVPETIFEEKVEFLQKGDMIFAIEVKDDLLTVNTAGIPAIKKNIQLKKGKAGFAAYGRKGEIRKIRID